MLATLTSADSGRSQLSLRDSGAVPCFARHCQTTSGSANEVSWEGIKSGGRACQRRDVKGPYTDRCMTLSVQNGGA